MSQQYPPQGQQPPSQPPYPGQQYPQPPFYQNGMPPVQQPPQPPRKRRRWPWIVGGIVLLIVIASIAENAAGGSKNTPPTNATAPTTQNTIQHTPAATPKPKNMAQQVSDIIANAGMLGQTKTTYGYTDNPKAVVVRDNIGDGNITNGLTVGEIHLECFTAQKALWTAHLTLTEVLVQINMNVVDQYGNESNQLVSTCDLLSQTEQQFNWSNLDQDSAWQDYDTTSIAPFLTK